MCVRRLKDVHNIVVSAERVRNEFITYCLYTHPQCAESFISFLVYAGCYFPDYKHYTGN